MPSLGVSVCTCGGNDGSYHLWCAVRIERDKEMILVKYQDFTLITIRIYVELRIYELSLLTLLIKTLPAPSEVACLPWNVLCVSVPALGQVLGTAGGGRDLSATGQRV